MRPAIVSRRRVRISRLAPTGEGISRGEHGVGFVAGALPGEEVVAEVEELRRTFWRGRAVEVLAASRDRVRGTEETCPGCDWGHFALAPAREAKRALFLETMKRLGGVAAPAFGDLPIVASPPGYRIRNRFHAAGRGDELMLGQFEARSHRVAPLVRCEALTPGTAELLPVVRDALAASGASISELATLETPDGGRRLARVTLAEISRRAARSDAAALVTALAPWFAGTRIVDHEADPVEQEGVTRIHMDVGARTFAVSVDSFFQGNRHLVEPLARYVGECVRIPEPGRALDAFGGVGFFASALLDGGHSVVSVEGSAAAARDAATTRLSWPDADRWRILPSSVAGFLATPPRPFDVVVADPPRAGLAKLAGSLAALARRRFVYVSCDPATLARDLRDLLEAGLTIADARLFDLFPLTHRVEAVVALERTAKR